MANVPRFVWTRVGDHRDEAERIIRENAKQQGGSGRGEPTVLVRTVGAARQRVTVLSASGDWWVEFLSVHGGWGEPVRDDDDVIAEIVAWKGEK